MSEIYVSTDIEVDGPIPGPHSMLSFGSAAFRADKTLISTFTANLDLLPGASPHLETMAWWAKRPEAWAACRKDLLEPAKTMNDYNLWLGTLSCEPLFLGDTSTFAFMFAYWY